MADSSILSWQANLLEPELLARGRRGLGGPLLPTAVAVVALAALASFTQAQWRSVDELRTRGEAARARVEQLKARVGDTAGQVAAEQALAAIESEAARAQALLATLKDAAAGGGADWSAASVLTTLSERHRDGLWLTRIVVDRTRRELKIEGQVEAATALSGWVAALGAGDGPLAGMSVVAMGTGQESDGGSGAADDGTPRTQKFRLDAKVLR